LITLFDFRAHQFVKGSLGFSQRQGLNSLYAFSQVGASTAIAEVNHIALWADLTEIYFVNLV
jgi:hypothetical protein